VIDDGESDRIADVSGTGQNTTSVSPWRAVRRVALFTTSFAPASRITESTPARRATSVVATLPSNDVESQSKFESSMRW